MVHAKDTALRKAEGAGQEENIPSLTLIKSF